MIRTDIITTVGRKYLTSNIENEEFSYGKALKEIGKNYVDYLSDDAKRTYKDLDIRFANDKLSILIETKQNNGCCYCIVDQHGERTFLCEHGGEYHYQKDWFAQLDMSEYQCIYICGLEIEDDHHHIIYDFLKDYSHLPLYFAPGPRLCHIPKQDMEDILSLHPIVHLNQKELLEYTQQTNMLQGCQCLYQKTQNAIVVTLGKDGCYFYQPSHSLTVPSPQVSVYNTNGAGDTHMGALIASRMQGDDWYTALQKANHAAALKISTQ